MCSTGRIPVRSARGPSFVGTQPIRVRTAANSERATVSRLATDPARDGQARVICGPAWASVRGGSLGLPDAAAGPAPVARRSGALRQVPMSPRLRTRHRVTRVALARAHRPPCHTGDPMLSISLPARRARRFVEVTPLLTSAIRGRTSASARSPSAHPCRVPGMASRLGTVRTVDATAVATAELYHSASRTQRFVNKREADTRSRSAGRPDVRRSFRSDG
jgi:hypothetical protein